MSLFSDIAGVVLFITPVLAVFAVWYHRQLTAKIRALEGDVSSAQEHSASLTKELDQVRRDAKRQGGSRPEAAGPKSTAKQESSSGSGRVPSPTDVLPAPSKVAKVDKSTQEARRIRELEAHLAEKTRQLDLNQRQLRGRDDDVRDLQLQLEELHMEIEHLKSRVDAAAPPVPKDEVARQVAPPQPVQSAPLSPDLVQLEQDLTAARRDLLNADKAVKDAKIRANLTEVDLRKAQERVTRLDKRAHELLERLMASEKETRRLQRIHRDSEVLYVALKGRYEVARDTLMTFRDKFGVEIPTEAGVPMYAPVEDVIELEDEEVDRPRPRPDRPRSAGSNGRGERRTARRRAPAGDELPIESDDPGGRPFDPEMDDDDTASGLNDPEIDRATDPGSIPPAE